MSNFYRTIALVASGLFVALGASAAGSYVPVPTPPKPIPQTLPLNAQITTNGVYVPVTKSGNQGVSLEKLPNAKPNETGGSATWTIKTR